ncbi:hypothetical protein L1887_58951 [Cichorium endivia]|nr:hypothetical protein L1887_58951 [Cichorium endivia]
MGNCTSWRPARLIRRTALGQRHVPLGAEGPYCWSANKAAGTRVASSPDSDLERLTFPIGGVNNPTLGEFCFTMIGRADIEGSKSNVAMNAWLPQASYPCGNFSDTSSFKFRRSKWIVRPRFHGSYSYWKSESNELLPFCSTRDFCSR